MTKLDPQTEVLTREEVDHFWTQGYLRVRDVYAPDEVAELADDLDLLIDRWARSNAWTGPWREALLDPTWRPPSSCAHCTTCGTTRRPGRGRRTTPSWRRAPVPARRGRRASSHDHARQAARARPALPAPPGLRRFTRTPTTGTSTCCCTSTTPRTTTGYRFLRARTSQVRCSTSTVAGGTMCSPHLPTDKYRLAEQAGAGTARRHRLLNINTVHGRTSTPPRRRDGWCGWDGTRTTSSSVGRQWAARG